MLFYLILINNQINNIYILFAIIIISMEKKVFHSKKGKKDFKSKRLNKEEKTLFPYTFLGISLESTPQISDAVYKSIVDLSEAFSSFSSSDILSFLKPKDAESNQNSIWKTPRTFHLTTLFHSNLDRESPILKAFQPDREAKIRIVGVAVVPTNIVTLIVLTDELVDNKFSHITFLIGNYKPVMSNNVMVALFDKGRLVRGFMRKLKKGRNVL